MNATISGSQITITGMQIAAAAVTITIRDDAGATLTLTVTAGTVPLAVNPTTVTAFVGDKIRGIITGGTQPYRVQTTIDESGLNAQIINGNIVEVVGGQVVSAAGVTIIDANNQSVDMKLTLAAGQDVLRVQPNTLTILESNNLPTITLMVYGASATGGIQVFHSFTGTTALLAPYAPVRNSDNTGYAVTLTGGNICVTADRTVTITVMDAKGKVGTSTVTIKEIGAAGNGCP